MKRIMQNFLKKSKPSQKTQDQTKNISYEQAQKMTIEDIFKDDKDFVENKKDQILQKEQDISEIAKNEGLSEPKLQEQNENYIKQDEKSKNLERQQQKVETKSDDDNDELLYKQLFKKYKISEKDLEENQKEQKSIQTTQERPKFDLQTFKLNKQKHISHYRKLREYDQFLEHTDIDTSLDHGMPKIYKNLENMPGFRPQTSLTPQRENMILGTAKRQIEFERALSKGSGFTWYAAKTGRLGVDLYLIIFGIIGVILIPGLLYKRHRMNQERWRKDRGLPLGIVDFEKEGYDLDELSVDHTFYNMFQTEIIEEKQKQIDIDENIRKLTDLLYKNK